MVSKLYMVRTSRGCHEYIWGGGGGGGRSWDARDNVLSMLGSVQYFTEYHEFIGGFHYFLVFNMN